jgi:DNA-damage-inducible protein J
MVEDAKKKLYKYCRYDMISIGKEVCFMAQTSVNFRMDAELKESVEEICRKMGMNLTTAITIFCTKVAQERRIPFEITADPDPFYSESNIRHLEKKMEDYKAGRLKLAEHELIEE